MALHLNETQKSNLLQLFKHFTSQFPREELIKRYKQLDIAYNMEVDKEIAEEAKENKKEDEEYSERFTSIDLPIVRQQVQSEVPFMENIFLTDNPIFAVDKTELTGDMEIAADGINAKIMQDSQIAGWALQISDFILKCAKYNIGMMEISWSNKSFFKKRLSATSTELERASVEWDGNAIKSLDPYNTFFDTIVKPWEVATSGEFAGYVEKLSHTSLAALVASLINLQKSKEDEMYLDYSEELWKKTSSVVTSEFAFHEPSVIPQNDVSKGGWASMSTDAGLDVNKKDSDKFGKSGSYYELVTIYIRFVPISIGIKVSDDDATNFTPQIWKLLIVGGEHILAAIPEDNSHNLIPIAIAKPDLDNLGLQAKSSVECTISLQRLAGEFLQRRLASIDRNIGDMAIYDPQYIDGTTFTKRIPDRKIPVKSNFSKSSKSLADIYRSIGFTDSSQSLMQMEIPMLLELAQNTNLSNQARYGSFVKGNKTPDEVRQTLSNSEAPLLRRALQIENQAFYFIKVMLQHNYVDYAQLEEIAQPDGTSISFDPVTLLSTVIKFRLAGGLDPLSIAMHQGELSTVFEMAMQIPAINQRYDLLKIFQDTFYARGLNLAKYTIPLEQQTAEAVAGNGGAGV